MRFSSPGTELLTQDHLASCFRRFEPVMVYRATCVTAAGGWRENVWLLRLLLLSNSIPAPADGIVLPTLRTDLLP